MKHTTRNRRRWLTRVALGLAVVAVAAPSAQAMIPASTSSDDSAQVTDGLGRPLDPAAVKAGEQLPSVVVDISKFRLATELTDEAVRPDDRAVRPAPVEATPVAQLPTIDQLRDFRFDGTQVPEAVPAPVRPDDRPVRPTIVGGGETPVVVVPTGRVGGPIPGNTTLVFDQPLVGGPTPGDTTLVTDEPQGAPASGPSFDWSDAGVGIGIGIAACLALLTAWLLLGGRKPDHFAGA
jgi:hypothetical protein